MAVVVFTPTNPDTQEAFGFFHITGILERTLNLFLLVPLAILTRICYRQRSLRAIFIICISTSISIELVQVVIPGRVSDPIDVMINSAGALCTLIGIKQIAREQGT